MNIASGVVKLSSSAGVNTFVYPKLSKKAISPVQKIQSVQSPNQEYFKGKLPPEDFHIPPEELTFSGKPGKFQIGRYVDVYA